MRFLVGVLFGILLVAIAAAAIVYTGSFNVSAIVPPSKTERTLATFALNKAVARRAPVRKNPLAASAETFRGGLAHFRENCVICHGAPGVDPREIGQGLNPGAPDLTLRRVQARSDGELFWITSNGIRMSGMPAFSPTHAENEIWQIVAFLRHLPEITEEETAALRPEAEETQHHHEEAPPTGGAAKPEHTHAPGTPPHED
ncbi:MAG TPA: cytochrome c [Thermoanaerobaculia bacterium]|nr:cytochrome c [Thermoanaerobaculia bacterium]